MVGRCVVILAVLAVACSSSSTSAPVSAPPDAGEPEPIEEADAGSPEPVSDGTSGSACEKNSDCQGKGAVCVKELDGIIHKDGFCTSSCKVKSDCPGKNSVCDRAACGRSCTDKSGSRPCRSGYLCSNGIPGPVCYAEGISQCDPNQRASCDAGLTCVRVGLDPVGQCFPGCDIFAQDCGAGEACYPTLLGEGNCATAGTKTDGQSCTNFMQCAKGLSCTDVAGGGAVCRPICGGPGNAPCTNGKTCVDFASSSPTSIAGVCAG
jgi:hypothetical protein